MSTHFNHRTGLIRVVGRVDGPAGVIDIQLALDTGALRTVINIDSLETVGYDSSHFGDDIEMTTASGVTRTQMIPVVKFSALQQTRFDFEVVAYDLPANVGVDGLLGLDFFRDRKLALDFIAGRTTLD